MAVRATSPSPRVDKPVMRIGVDARSLIQREVRGEGKTLLRLYREIRRLRPEWAVRMYGERGAPEQLAKEFNVRSRSVPGHRFNIWERLFLPLMAARDRIKLLHCSSGTAPPAAPCPFVITVHDIVPLVIDDGQTADQSRRFEAALRSGLRRAAAVIAVSESTKRDLVSYFGTPADRITVIHWGADAEQLSQGPRSPVATGEAKVLAFGGDAPRKNTAGVLRTFARLKERAPSARLVLVGLSGARKREEFESLSRQLGIADRVQFEGYVTEERLQDMYRQATVLFYPSLYEGFGMPLVEAMAHGLPVVASNRTSIPEVVGTAGVLVDPTDENAMAGALATVLADPDRLRELRARSRNRVSELTWESCARKTIGVFERVVL